MNSLLNVEPMAKLFISLNLGGLGLLIALLRLAYWLNTGARAVMGLVMLAAQGFTCYGTRQVLTQEPLATGRRRLVGDGI